MKTIQMPSRRRLWSFSEYESAGGRGEITDWYLGLSPAVQAVFDDRLEFLSITERRDWQMPEFHLLHGAEGKAGLSEIRWKEGVQWRVIGYFPSQTQYAMLIGCFHKQNRYTPANALETAMRRKRQIENGERRLKNYEP